MEFIYFNLDIAYLLPTKVNNNLSIHLSVCILVPLLTATYTRDNTEELLFSGADNPSPLLEIVEQELAWRAEGKVDVFIDSLRDISALRNILKVTTKSSA